MLDHSTMSCETDGAENIMSSTSVQQAEDGGVTCTDTTTQQLSMGKDESVTCEVGEDTMLNSDIVETLGDMDNKGNSYGETLISSVELSCQFGLQNGSADPCVDFCTYEVLWSSEENTCLDHATVEEQQEKISEYLQDDGSSEGKQEEVSQKDNHESLSQEENSSRVEQEPENFVNGDHETLQSEHPEQMVETGAERANVIVDGANKSLVEEKETTPCGFSKSLCGVEQKSPNASDTMDCPSEQMGPLLVGTPEKLNGVVLGLPVCVDGSYNSPIKTKETPQRGLSKNLFGTPLNQDATDAMNMNSMVLGLAANGFNESGGSKKKQGKTPAVKIERKYPLRSLEVHTRISSPRSRENTEGRRPSTNLENGKGSVEKRRRKNKAKMMGKTDDEFARMRRHLRYLLKRIQCEQNLLDVYSSEGWRGQSAEKLRPEKELERAKAEINRNKLKIRDLFQRLDSLSCEGKFPESLFDSDGLIDSEDIFCAKCGTKDSAIDNDIILCDGACDRGFHQCCLEPPLRTEEIPPDDEGWLCPTCDCKVDCLDLLNDSHGTKLTVEDSWEKVFPDIAAAAMAGSTHDQTMDLPSDDSEDNDYNPNGTDDDDEVERSKSSSDESGSATSDSSDFSSASDDLKDVCVNETEAYLGLPSEDSEDDDYNPDDANVDEDDEHQSSRSDFSSASDDLCLAVDVDETLSDREAPSPLLENDQDMGEIPSVSGRRNVQRLDYKKLYDETYGNACSDSSDDDEEWMDIDTSKKKKRKGDSGAGVSPSSIADTLAPVDNSVSAGTSKKRGRTKPSAEVTDDSPALMNESSPNVGSTGKKRPLNKIGDFARQKLYESFKNNRYPDHDVKEKLAKEAGLTAKQVTKWFENARWSFNHHRAKMEATMSAVASQSNSPHNVACDKTKTSSADANKGDERTSIPRRSSRLNKINQNQSNLRSDNIQTSDHEAPSPLLEKNQDMDEISFVSGARYVQRLDYKKPYDETYGKACPHSGNDEEWTDIKTSKKKSKPNSGAGVSHSSIGDTLAPVDSSVSVGTSKKSGRTKPNTRAKNSSPSPMKKSSPNIGSTGKKSPHNKIGDVATQKLYESFKNNRYPDRDMKEKLAKEVGLTVKQVIKWFDNARSSFNHHRARFEATMSAVASQSNTSPNVACDKTGTSSADPSENCRAKSSKPRTNEGDLRTPTPRRSSRLNRTDKDQSNCMSGNRDTSVGTSEAHVVHRKRKRSRG